MLIIYKAILESIRERLYQNYKSRNRKARQDTRQNYKAVNYN